MGSECGPGGSQSRAVWCAHSEGWTTLHTNCNQKERPDNQQDCFRVCDWHKDLYDWQLGAWNQCVPVSMRSAGVQRPAVCARGEEGIQTREVGCVHKTNGEPADDTICEYFEPKPRLEQACLIPCPRDCVVSQFTAWTSCSKTCGMGLQNRIRSVLAPPLFGGAACPNLTEFQTCQLRACEGNESLYSLKVGPWGPCSVPLSRQARQAEKPPAETFFKDKDKLSGDKQSGEGEKQSKGGKKEAAKGLKQSGESERRGKEGAGSMTESEEQNKEDPGPKDGDKLSRDADKPPRSNRKSSTRLRRKQERPSRQADRDKRQKKKAKNKEKKEKKREKVQERMRERGKAKDPETRELLKKKRTKNRQNRPGGKSWEVQFGFQTREVTCVHKNGDVEALR